MRALKQFARERGLLYHTHLAEGKAETERIRAWTGRGEAEELAHLGVLDESTILAHSIWLTQERSRCWHSRTPLWRTVPRQI